VTAPSACRVTVRLCLEPCGAHVASRYAPGPSVKVRRTAPSDWSSSVISSKQSSPGLPIPTLPIRGSALSTPPYPVSVGWTCAELTVIRSGRYCRFATYFKIASQLGAIRRNCSVYACGIWEISHACWWTTAIGPPTVAEAFPAQEYKFGGSRLEHHRVERIDRGAWNTDNARCHTAVF